MSHHHSHPHPHHKGGDRRLWLALLLTAGFSVVEAVSGWLASSLALLGDAGHMASDASALGIAAIAAVLARRPPSDRHSYGLLRIEIVAALINGLFMLLVVFFIAWHAIERLQSPQPVQGGMVMIVAGLGLMLNVFLALLLHGGDDSLNTRAALLHVMGDLLGSVAALVAGLVIYITGWMPIDPLLSLLICILILVSSFSLLRDVLHVIMEGVPNGLVLPQVGQSMAAVDGVESIHDLHIWTLSSGVVSLSAHVVVSDIQQWQAVLDALRSVLHAQYGIDHVTLQPEPFAQRIHHIVDVQDKTGSR